MENLERSYRALLVSASVKMNAALQPILSDNGCTQVTVMPDVSSARQSVLENAYDLVLINAPLPDEYGTRFALDLCASGSAGILLLVRAENFGEINARVAPFGVLTLSKPTSPQIVSQSLTLLCATR